MTVPPQPPRWVERFVVSIWVYLVLAGGAFGAFGASGAERLVALALSAASVVGLVASWRHLKAEETFALAPAYAQPTAMLGVLGLIALSSELAPVRWLWFGLLVLTPLVLVGEYRSRAGRPLRHDRWIENHLTRRQRAAAIFGSTALAAVPMSVWLYVELGSVGLVAPALVLPVLVVGYRYSVRSVEEDGVGTPG